MPRMYGSRLVPPLFVKVTDVPLTLTTYSVGPYITYSRQVSTVPGNTVTLASVL